jgi:hypothetical protein
MHFRARPSIEQLHILKIYIHLFFQLIPTLELTSDGLLHVSLSTIKVLVGRLVVVIDVNPSHGFWTRRLVKLFGHEGK